ncbi:metallophosphoesterase [Kocuria sp.]|uniref:metallophosphoesterase n=1 Tax=Kocuria sp. TaxID=1871328 RepID=UPI0026DF5F40|nr:metallophosphoesterase [Kocuria sp.]MDO5617854.1 metallophosphoesterase [Kocuria sp.]
MQERKPQEQDVVVVNGDDYDPATGPAQRTDVGFADPEDYDFAIVHLTDTQYIAEGAADPSDPDRQARFKAAHDAIARWVGENAERRKIVYLAHTGDLVENWCWFWNRRSTARREFQEAGRLISMIEDYGVPVGVLPGNHDNRWGSDEGRGSPELKMFNKTFGPIRTMMAQRQWRPRAGELEVEANYGGPWKAGENSCHYDLVTVGDTKLIFLHLGYGVRDEHTAWANDVLRQYADRDAIICTHYYLDQGIRPDGSGAPYGGPGSYGPNDGVKIHREVVSQHSNVVMVLCGHISGTGWRLEDQVAYPSPGLLADYQAHRMPDEEFPVGYRQARGERRTGFLRLLQFRVADGTVRVSTYSPVLDSFQPGDFAPQSQLNQLLGGRDAAEVAAQPWAHPDHLILPVELRSQVPGGRNLPADGTLATDVPNLNDDAAGPLTLPASDQTLSGFGRTETDVSGRVIPDKWGTALTVAGAVGAALVVRKLRRR